MRGSLQFLKTAFLMIHLGMQHLTTVEISMAKEDLGATTRRIITTVPMNTVNRQHVKVCNTPTGVVPVFVDFKKISKTYVAET